MTKTLQLGFTLTSGKTLTLRVEQPKDNLTEQQINAAMDAIIQADVFQREFAGIGAKKSAKLIERHVTAYELV